VTPVSEPIEGEGERVCHFDFSGNVDLAESQMWPDGDAPANWTASDVAEVVKKCGGTMRVLHDWDLDDYLMLTVVADDDTGETL
jgi:hypothetical protein